MNDENFEDLKEIINKFNNQFNIYELSAVNMLIKKMEQQESFQERGVSGINHINDEHNFSLYLIDNNRIKMALREK